MFRIIIFLLIIALIACNDNKKWQDAPFQIRVPAGFAPIAFPEGNEPTQLRVLLGRKLFYDKRLSAENNMSCGTCHVASAAFTDGKKVNTGMHNLALKRNSPTLANMAWSPYFMMEGGVPTLELQALAPLHNSHEMGMDMMQAIAVLNEDDALRALAKAAYGRDSIDPFVVTRSLATFQRTFVSGDSRYDRYQLGLKDQMNEEEIAGMNLFFAEKTKCSSCHAGELITDFGIYNIGLYEVYDDVGLERKTHKTTDNGKFKTPTMRNIDLTAPYMHDGSMNSLEEVIEFYNTGGKPHANKDLRIQPLNLSPEEKEQLTAFLKTLTDYNFVQNAMYLPLEEQ
jgi:cytochrome c peroxidase